MCGIVFPAKRRKGNMPYIQGSGYLRLTVRADLVIE